MMDPYTYLASLPDSLPEIPPDSILSRTVFADDQIKVVLFGFAPGQELSEHTASQPALLHFLEGEADLTLGGDAVEARAGTWVHMVPRLSHSVKARTPVRMLLILLRGGAEPAP
ncbi:MAG: cupin domain-containing protein [Chloroflexi bacterium]|nr:cupin domain-containing protein [Chloroflexota bacterium]